MKKYLDMSFRNGLNDVVTLVLAEPKDDLTLAQVTTAMEDIITRNIFTTSGGALVSVDSAVIRIADKQELA